ncbi:ketopantoate reductase family protein [Ramlibacter alkalitolerans]|uniref:2-dehydropantoate 2-reductase n=1 Tax=Ramlibacter alkalitolerans TaxID=2039631 RepID=A0ABS1JJM3_9BURK|nr:2-dehydropantoate 2-reductase [Ramlibacter alkalitolerans]MBL0424414.1 2-dehydropantoate 2-reductase [Ramlibacter alkalitolerans]
MTRVLVVGVGAIGGIVAAKLAGYAQVVGVDSNVAHARCISEHGLELQGATRLRAHFPCVTHASELIAQPFDAIVFLVKSRATAQVLQDLAGHLASRPLLLTLQNGMGNAELLAATGAPVARGATMTAGRYVAPGQVEHLIRGNTWIGPWQGSLADMRWFSDLLCAAGLPCEVLEDPMDTVWSKFVFNCVMNPVGALVAGHNAARYEVPEVCALVDTMAEECQQVVRALGGSFSFDPMAFVHKVRSGAVPLPRHAGSMALDIARGEETEIDALTGWIVVQAERLGIPVPACRTVTALVKGLEYAARERHSPAKESSA